jgi:hypothetical protein
LPDGVSEIFLREGLDGFLPDGQISLNAQMIFVRARKPIGATFALQVLWVSIIFLKAEIATTK